MKTSDPLTNNHSDWIKRNMIDEPRLSEPVETYRSLDVEVKLKEWMPDEYPNECMLVSPERFKFIYTRKINDRSD